MKISRNRHIRTMHNFRRYRRKILYALLALLVILTSVQIWNFVSPNEASAAEVYLGLNEGYGTSASDTNSTVTAGTITNAVWKTEDLCKQGKCLYFDGTGDYVTFADNANLDMGSGEAVTVEGWFRTTPISSGSRVLISKYESTGSDGGYQIYLNSSGQIVFAIDNENTSFPSDSVTTTSRYDDNKWHYFSAVKNGSTSITLYMDALLIGSDTSIQNDVSNNDSFIIGADNAGANGWLGFIDEVKVMRSARSQSEIKADFLGATPDRGTSASFGPDNSWISDGLVGYWKMDEASGTRYDFSGNNNNLTDNNTVTSTTGKFGNASDFVSSNSEYLEYVNGIDISKTFTLSAWVRPDAIDGERYLISNGGTWNNLSYTMQITWSSLDLKISVDGVGSNNILVSTGGGYVEAGGGYIHHVITYDGTTVRLFANGQEMVVGDFPYNLSIDGINQSSGPLLIGTVPDEYNHYDGLIDDVRIYNRALSPAEIRQLADWAPGPVGYWKFDENSGTTTNDSSGNGNNSSSFTNDVTWSKGKFGSAIKFGSTSDYITIPSSSSLDYIPAFTFSAWLKPYAVTSYNIIDKTGGDSTGWSFRINSNKWAFSADSSGTSLVCDGPIEEITAGIWQHVTVSWDGSSTCSGVKLYQDSIEQSLNATQSMTGTRDDDSGNDLLIGTNTYSDDYRGEIDDFKIYNYVRTPSQIIEDMNGGHPLGGSPIGSQVGHWKFDEMYGDTSHDSNPNQIHGDLGGSDTSCPATGVDCPTWTANGKINGALDFDGNDIVLLDSYPYTHEELNATERFTITAWVKSDASGTADNTSIFKLGNFASQVQYSLNIEDGVAELRLHDNTPYAAGTTIVNSSGATWYHIAATWDKDLPGNNAKVYVNGVLEGEGARTTALNDSWQGVYVGGDSGGGDFNGMVDEVKFYSAALTAEQIRIDMNAGSSAAMGGVLGNSEASQLTDGAGNPPVAYWNFNEKTGTTANDILGNGLTGTLNNFPTNPWVRGYKGNGSALVFDGTDDDVSVGNSSLLDLADNMTISAWIYPTGWGESSYGTIVARGPNDFGSGYQFNIVDANLALWYNNSSVASNSDVLSLNTWQHVVVSIASDVASFYVNGIYQGGGSWNLSAGGTDTLYIGSVDGSNETFEGMIDEVKIYNYARTPSQVTYDYNRGAPVGHWQFDECSGTVANDISGNGNNGTITPGTGTDPDNDAVGTCSSGNTDEMWNDGTTGKFNASLGFDGVDDTVTLPSVSILDISDGNLSRAFSLATWIYAKSDGESNGGNIANFDSGNLYFEVNGESGSSLDLEAHIQLSGSNATIEIAGGLTTNTWHHVVFVWEDDADDEITLFIDGVNRGSSTNGSGSTSVGATSWAIGGNGGYNFDGLIDDFRLYNYALSPAQIKTVMNNGAIYYGPVTGSP